MSTNEQLQKVIRAMVIKEAKAIVPALVKEVMANMLMEIATNPTLSENTRPITNTSKRQTLQEISYGHASELEEYQTMNPNRFNFQSPAAPRQMIVDTMLTSEGHPMPIRGEVPDHVVAALTKNYANDEFTQTLLNTKSPHHYSNG